MIGNLNLRNVSATLAQSRNPIAMLRFALATFTQELAQRRSRITQLTACACCDNATTFLAARAIDNPAKAVYWIVE